VQQNLSFLVVDDFSTMRRIIKNLLNDLGYANITEADDGTSALPMFKSGKFDFLITDWNMPGMPGLDLVKHVRADPRLGKMPVLMLTAEAKREQIVEAVQAGVNGYVIKPFTAVTLKEKIEKFWLRELLWPRSQIMNKRLLDNTELLSWLQAMSRAVVEGDEDALAEALSGLVRLGHPNVSNVTTQVRRVANDLQYALDRFQIDSKLIDMAQRQVPDARLRLEHVLRLTADAAHRTLDLVERSAPLAEHAAHEAQRLLSQHRRALASTSNEAQMLAFLTLVATSMTTVKRNLAEVLITQGYQDLSGQIIRGVMKQIQELELALSELLRIAGSGGVSSNGDGEFLRGQRAATTRYRAAERDGGSERRGCAAVSNGRLANDHRSYAVPRCFLRGERRGHRSDGKRVAAIGPWNARSGAHQYHFSCCALDQGRRGDFRLQRDHLLHPHARDVAG
jgi:two-component system chemotaxis response regulator CheY